MTGVHRSELTPVAFLQRAAYLHPARVAVAHEDGRRITYGELEERCHRLANALRARGVRHGDRVAVLSPNAPAILEAHYAVPLAGGVLVAINTRLAPAEVGHILRHSGARVLLVDHALAPLVEPLELGSLDVVRIDDSGRSDDPYEQLIASGAPERAGDLARARGGADLHQLHLGHDRRAQGRRLHASRRVPERARPR